MAYTIYHADGIPEYVQDNEIDDAFYNRNANGLDKGVGVQLVGRNRVNYGSAIAQNFLQQAENFSSLTAARPPSGTALQGQLWFEKLATAPTASGKLYLRVAQLGDNTAWNKVVVEDTSGNITVTGYYLGDGSGITNISASAVNNSGSWAVVNPVTAKDGDIKVVGAVIYIYASTAWRQVWPAQYS